MVGALRAQATSSGFHPPVAQDEPDQPGMSRGWVLLLAVLLGLAAGTVVAVVTLR